MKRWGKLLPAAAAWAAFAAVLATGGRLDAARLLGGFRLPDPPPTEAAVPLSGRTVNALIQLAADQQAVCGASLTGLPPLMAWLRDHLNQPLALIESPAGRGLAAGRWRAGHRFAVRARWEAGQELLARLAGMNAFFLANDGINRRLLGNDRLLAAAANPETQAAVAAILALDRQAALSETGGIAILRYPPGAPPVITFAPLASALDPLTSQLLALSGDPAAVVRFAEQQPGRFELARDETAIFVREARKLRQPQALAQRTRMFTDHWLFMARRSYVFWDSALACLLLEQPLRGTYLGVFHVHPPDNPPSWEDRLTSAIHRELILVPMPEGFDLHVLTPGDGTAGGLVVRIRQGIVTNY